MHNGYCCAKSEDETKLITHTLPLIKNALVLQVYNFSGGVILFRNKVHYYMAEALQHLIRLLIIRRIILPSSPSLDCD